MRGCLAIYEAGSYRGAAGNRTRNSPQSAPYCPGDCQGGADNHLLMKELFYSSLMTYPRTFAAASGCFSAHKKQTSFVPLLRNEAGH